jgi:hypothetical protein
MKGILKRLSDAIAIARCKGGPVFGKDPTERLPGEPTSGPYIRVVEYSPILFWQCPNKLERCTSCPRLQAYRQGLSVEKDRANHLQVTVGSDQVKPNMGDSDWEAAQVDYIHGNYRFTPWSSGARVRAEPDAVSVFGAKVNVDPHTHAILNPIAPGVINPEHCTEHRDGKGYQLSGCVEIARHDVPFIKEFILTQRGVT